MSNALNEIHIGLLVREFLNLKISILVMCLVSVILHMKNQQRDQIYYSAAKIYFRAGASQRVKQGSQEGDHENKT